MSRLLCRQRVREVLLGAALLCATLALLLYPSDAIQAAKDGLLLCPNPFSPVRNSQ